jgi:hypothetical protein
MKSFLTSRIRFVLVSSAMTVAFPVFAQSADPSNHVVATTAKTGKLVKVTEKDAAWAAKTRKEYPLNVCLTSDEKLGSMGKSPEYIYRVDGHADRLVVFCCEGCEEDFLKEPAKYLAKLDAAKSGKANAGAKAHDPHTGQH